MENGSEEIKPQVSTLEGMPDESNNGVIPEHDTAVSQETEGSAELMPVPEPKLWIYTTNEARNDFHISWEEPTVPEELKTEHFTISSHGLDTQISDDVRGGEFKTIRQALADGNSLSVLVDGHGLNGDIRWGNTQTKQ